jgi:hypothetical protein
MSCGGGAAEKAYRATMAGERDIRSDLDRQVVQVWTISKSGWMFNG